MRLRATIVSREIGERRERPRELISHPKPLPLRFARLSPRRGETNTEGWKLRGGRAVDERGWSGFGRVGFLRIFREQPRCIRGPLGLNLRELGGGETPAPRGVSAAGGRRTGPAQVAEGVQRHRELVRTMSDFAASGFIQSNKVLD
jgi:hypothetical protein